MVVVLALGIIIVEKEVSVEQPATFDHWFANSFATMKKCASNYIRVWLGGKEY